MTRGWLAICSIAVFCSGSVAAQELATLEEFLASIDRTPVSVEGRIKYDERENDFVFYNLRRQFFHASIDAGRATRERIEDECTAPQFLATFDDLCTISAIGSVEVRGGRVLISIEEVFALSPAR